MAGVLFGWDLTYKSVEQNISSKEDLLFVFLHWNLIKQGFRCLGVGNEKTLKDGEKGYEVLPDNWRSGNSLRYTYFDDLFIFHAISSDGSSIYNLMRAKDLCVSNIAFNVDETVVEKSGNIEVAIPGYAELINKIKRELTDTVTDKTKKTCETQTIGTTTINDVEREGLRQPPRYRGNTGNISPPGANIGFSDLNPLAPPGFGGGMIFEPFGQRNIGPINPGFGVPGGLPRASIPPGARFDPFGPPQRVREPLRHLPPDADHFIPPGYDDMFM